MFRKILYSFILLCLVSLSCGAQEKAKIVVAYDIADNSQFSYKAPTSGASLTGYYKFSPRWEGILNTEWLASEKTFLSDGHTLVCGIGARFYLTDNIFILGSGSITSHRNSKYTKTVSRDSVGIGIKASDFVGTLSFLGPIRGTLADPNSLKGMTVVVEYFKPIIGNIGFYSSGRVSIARFVATFDPSKHYIGESYGGKVGLFVKF
jgi:hypothetical protein